MRIETLALDAAVPDDLDDRVFALTSLSVAELHRQLAAPGIAGTIAKAVIPLLADPPSVGTLARQIVLTGQAAAVRAEVRAIYASVLESRAEPAASPEDDADEIERGDSDES